jgi:hypothetical protein
LKKLLLTICLLLLMSSNAAAQDLRDQIQGTWVSDYMTVIFDFPNNSYEGVNMGRSFSEKITVIKQYANVLILSTGEHKVVIQIREDGDIMVTKNDDSFTILKRFKQLEN